MCLLFTVFMCRCISHCGYLFTIYVSVQVSWWTYSSMFLPVCAGLLVPVFHGARVSHCIYVSVHISWWVFFRYMCVCASLVVGVFFTVFTCLYRSPGDRISNYICMSVYDSFWGELLTLFTCLFRHHVMVGVLFTLFACLHRSHVGIILHCIYVYTQVSWWACFSLYFRVCAGLKVGVLFTLTCLHRSQGGRVFTLFVFLCKSHGGCVLHCIYVSVGLLVGVFFTVFTCLCRSPGDSISHCICMYV